MIIFREMTRNASKLLKAARNAACWGEFAMGIQK